MTTWNEVQARISQPGSVILQSWMAERQAQRASATVSGHPRDPAIAEFLGGGGTITAAGVSVTADSAMRVAAVFACVRVLAETLASVPLILYRRLPDGGKERAKDHPLYRMVAARPNGWQSRFEFIQNGVASLLLRGASYNRIVGRRRGEQTLVPLKFTELTPRLLDSGKVAYDWRPMNGPRQTLLQEEVVRIPFMTVDGIRPLSVIGAQREVVGASLASQDYTARFWANDAKPVGGWLEVGSKFPDIETKEKFTEALNAKLKARRHGVLVLEPNMKYHEIGMSNQDAQFLETRKYQRSEIAGLFRVPPHMIGDLDRATFSNIEHQSIEWVKNGVLPLATNWEQCMNRDLLSDYEQDDYFFEFLLDGLQRGDQVSRYQSYAVGRQWGWLSANDIRRLENMDPIDGGNTYLAPLNMTPADLLAKQISDKLKEPANA